MSVGTVIFLVNILGELGALLVLLLRRGEPNFRWLRWFFALSLAANLATRYVLEEFGYRSAGYAYTWFATDLACTIFGFFVLSRLIEAAFADSALKLPGLRTGALVVFTGLSTCSAAVVYLMRGSLSVGRVCLEMEQNFNFLGMLLAVVLFVIINMMQVPGVRFRRVVLSFSVFYSTGAISYSLIALFPGLNSLMSLYGIPAINTACILLLAYSIWVPEAPRARDLAALQARARLAGAGLAGAGTD